MNFALLSVNLDRLINPYGGGDPNETIRLAKKLLYHSKRLRKQTDERSIERIVRKVCNITGQEWDAETTEDGTFLVGPLQSLLR